MSQNEDKKPRLIQQGESSTSIAEGGIPVIALFNLPKPIQDVTKAVNFLRCGCPQAQLVIGSKSTIIDDPNECHQKIEAILKNLNTKGETLTASLSQNEPWIITISRETNKT